MQYVRNVLKSDPSLTPEERAAATADTPGRKIQEMRYAVALEKQLSKDEILERYLNIAYFGAGAYGIAAAAQTLLRQAAERADPARGGAAGRAWCSRPTRDNPIDGDQAAALDRRRATCSTRWPRRAHHRRPTPTAARPQPIWAQAAQPRPTTAPPSPRRTTTGASSATTSGSGGTRQPEFGATVAEPRRTPCAAAATPIVTVAGPGRPGDRAGRSRSRSTATATPRRCRSRSCSPGTGRVLALAVNRHYSLRRTRRQPEYPNTVNQLVAGGGGVTGYQAGSTFKMFTMLAALEAGQAAGHRLRRARAS